MQEKEIQKIIVSALREDKASQDITAKTLFESDQKVTAQIIVKQDGILCGVRIAGMVFKQIEPQCKLQFHADDGEKIKKNQKILNVSGNALKLLSAERTALNFLQHLSGIATLTGKFVQAVKGTKAKIYDTRKTLPGLRALQKYAVQCGGGYNHRMNLSEMAMVKDNHLKAITSNKLQVTSLKTKFPKGLKLEIEAKNLQEVSLALETKADIILLDNMTIPQMRQAIKFIRSYSRLTTQNSRPLVEVSGGVTLKNVRKIAKLGVDRISVGALTHSAPALDISMEVL